jgi:uncharacterized Zn finger protein
MTIENEKGTLRSTVHVKELQGASRALEVVARDPKRGQYLVASARQPGVFYRVDLMLGEMTGQCSCPWGRHGGLNCKHVLAALREHYLDEGQLSFWRDRAAALRQHRPILDGQGLIATLRRRQAG